MVELVHHGRNLVGRNAQESAMKTLRISDDVYGALQAACEPKHAGVDNMAEDILRRELRVAPSDARLAAEAQSRLDELLGKNSAAALSPERDSLDR